MPAQSPSPIGVAYRDPAPAQPARCPTNCERQAGSTARAEDRRWAPRPRWLLTRPGTVQSSSQPMRQLFVEIALAGLNILQKLHSVSPPPPLRPFLRYLSSDPNPSSATTITTKPATSSPSPLRIIDPIGMYPLL